MNKNTKHKTSIGGQALIEGIMMRGPKGTAMSLRLPDGTIETEIEQYIEIVGKDTFDEPFKKHVQIKEF